ncbi:MAG TPA: helix-turn-helix transcriptional regulator [Firmicutes bacterium]|nr:helix-turn-helix transcriptional regulator [Bacillota bacterium]
MIQFGDTLKKLRQRMGLRQDDVARMVGVERSTVANWERGAKQPSLETLVKLGQLFGISLDELLGVTKVATALPLACYCSLVSDPLVKLLAERTGVRAKSIAAFIAALQISDNDCTGGRKDPPGGHPGSHGPGTHGQVRGVASPGGDSLPNDTDTVWRPQGKAQTLSGHRDR